METKQNETVIKCWKQHREKNPFPRYGWSSLPWVKREVEELNMWNGNCWWDCDDWECKYRDRKEQMLRIAKKRLAELEARKNVRRPKKWKQ